jgi:MSHA biogenesis protein MshJ
MRERSIVLAAAVGLVIVIFNHLLTHPLDVRRAQLLSQLSELQSGLPQAPSGTADGTDPTIAYTTAAELKTRLDAVDAQLSAQSAGMIPPKRMSEVIHDVLRLQHGVKLVSLRSLPAIKLPPDSPEQAAAAASADGTPQAPPGTHPPYVHAVEVVLEGQYLDVLSYLESLEALPWHFYWRRLDLTAAQHPINRVTVELGTVSMDSEWLDL